MFVTAEKSFNLSDRQVVFQKIAQLPTITTSLRPQPGFLWLVRGILRRRTFQVCELL